MVYGFDSVIGRLALETGQGRVCRVWLPGELPEHCGDGRPCGLAAEAAAQIQAYLEGRLQRFDLPLQEPPGTELQRRISAGIASVPYGRTATYASLGPARVVGHVCATNPLPLIIPCHRIVPAHGAPGRYRGGTPLKQWLLDMEKRHTPFTLHA